MRKFVLILVLVLPLIIGSSVMAFQPYEGYNYNSWGVSVPAPNAYSPNAIINGSSLGTVPLLQPSDMFYKDGVLYVLDAGNSRVLILNSEYDLIKEINVFHSSDGSEEILQDPQSIFVDAEGNLIIADTNALRVIICDQEGNILRTLSRPDSDIFPESLEFKPEKVISDKQGNIYVLCTGFYYGAVVYDAKDRFAGFFGANLVDVSLQQLSDMFWRMFMTRTQKSFVSKYVPVDYSSMDIDNEDFIYTCSRTSNSRNEIKKLNPLGSNILQAEITYDPLNKSDYGELEKLWYNGSYIDTRFNDIDISDRGIINALDFTYGRIFQYDQDSNLLSVFGGMGSQSGMFKMPVAIESVKDDVLVLDSDKASITVFKLTEYGQLVLDATVMYNEGMYSEAMDQWDKVIMQNHNSELAYRGIGRAYLQQGDYSKALQYLKDGQDRAGYSKAFGYYRSQIVRENFPFIASFAALTALIFIFWDKIRRKIRKHFPDSGTSGRFVNPFRVMLHPIDGLEEVRSQKGKGQFFVSIVIIVFWFLISIIERQGTGFIFNLDRPEGLDLLLMAAKTAGIFLLFVVCSWAVGSLNQGEASLIKLINITSCAIFPYVLALLIKTIISNFIVYEEGALLEWALTFVLLYSMLMLFIGNMKSHQYTVSKTFASLALSGISMMIAAFVMILIFSLIQQLTIFVMTLYNEILFRL
ncbi:MAG: YIP1 family protein [Saccharofermentanales bacterium]